MLQFFNIFFFLIITFYSKAEIKEKIIHNLKNIDNLDFRFEQNINGKIENGHCTIEYQKKYSVNMLEVIIKFWFQMEYLW